MFRTIGTKGYGVGEKMTIQEQVKKDMYSLMKVDTDISTLNTLKYIVGEFSREPTKEITDSVAIKIIKKTIESEKIVNGSSRFIEILEGYLPIEAKDAEIKEWISNNVDFTKFKNRMQAMKIIMEKFSGRTDGNKVKNILEQSF